jgi:hypothetical protein
MATVSSFVPALLSKLPTFTLHASQCRSSIHGLLSHTRVSVQPHFEYVFTLKPRKPRYSLRLQPISPTWSRQTTPDQVDLKILQSVRSKAIDSLQDLRLSNNGAFWTIRSIVKFGTPEHCKDMAMGTVNTVSTTTAELLQMAAGLHEFALAQPHIFDGADVLALQNMHGAFAEAIDKTIGKKQASLTAWFGPKE